jgi:uncharacterized protein YcbK (DUF882 family)
MFTDITAVKANRDENLLAFCDAILLAEEVGKLDAFIATLNGAVKSTDTTPTTKEATMPVKSVDWKSRPASKAQVARTVAMAEAKGKHTMRNVKTGELMPITTENVAGMTAGGASKLYNAMKNVEVKEEVTVKPATMPATPVVSVKDARKAMKEAKKAARKARKNAPVSARLTGTAMAAMTQAMPLMTARAAGLSVSSATMHRLKPEVHTDAAPLVKVQGSLLAMIAAASEFRMTGTFVSPVETRITPATMSTDSKDA